ncbi:MAG: hypothetical protein ABI112_07680 [Terracoccus sp.]
MRVRVLAATCLLLTGALLVSAVVLWADDTQFGWFAYAPLSDQAPSNLVIMTGRREAAVIVGAVGLLLLGSLGGFAFGLRRGADRGA